MIRYYFKTARDDLFQEVPSLRDGVWIHVEEATPQDLGVLAEIIQVEYTDLQDCLDRYELPRIEKIQNSVLIFTRHPSDLENGLYTSTLAIILAPHYTITISPHKAECINRFLQIKSKFSTLQRSKFLVALLMRINQDFTNSIRRMRHSVLCQEKEMNAIDSDDITSLTKSEELLNQYWSALAPMKSVLEEISSGRFLSLYEKDFDLLFDLLTAVKQSEELCSISVKSIRNLRDSYQIIFTNNVSRTIKLLTALTILFGIPTMIASFYGMNIGLPFAKRHDAFYILLILTTATVIVTAILFRRKRWL